MTNLDETHPHWLFVYGTLKRGNGNNRLLVGHNSVFVSPAVTKDKFLLNDGFPFVFPLDDKHEKHAGRVRGDLYRVSDAGLRACDALEGHPNAYCRTPIRVEYMLEDCVTQEVEAGIYLMTHGRGFMDLQEPDKEGFLEWGRDREDEARDFQRRGRAAVHRRRLLRRY